VVSLTKRSFLVAGSGALGGAGTRGQVLVVKSCVELGRSFSKAVGCDVDART
jgi:hypothetical protein